jgi:hypothetical protein
MIDDLREDSGPADQGGRQPRTVDGIPQSTHYWRRTAEWEYAARKAEVDAERAAAAHERQTNDLPWVEVVDDEFPPHPHYDLRGDRLEKPAGKFRINCGRYAYTEVHDAGEEFPGLGDDDDDDDTPPPPVPRFKPKLPRGKKRHDPV